MLIKSFRRIGCVTAKQFFCSLNKSNNAIQVTSSGKKSQELLSLMEELKIQEKNLPTLVKLNKNITK